MTQSRKYIDSRKDIDDFKKKFKRLAKDNNNLPEIKKAYEIWKAKIDAELKVTEPNYDKIKFKFVETFEKLINAVEKYIKNAKGVKNINSELIKLFNDCQNYLNNENFVFMNQGFEKIIKEIDTENQAITRQKMYQANYGDPVSSTSPELNLDRKSGPPASGLQTSSSTSITKEGKNQNKPKTLDELKAYYKFICYQFVDLPAAIDKKLNNSFFSSNVGNMKLMANQMQDAAQKLLDKLPDISDSEVLSSEWEEFNKNIRRLTYGITSAGEETANDSTKKNVLTSSVQNIFAAPFNLLDENDLISQFSLKMISDNSNTLVSKEYSIKTETM